MKRVIKLILFFLGLLLLFILIYQVGFFRIVEAISKANLLLLFSGVLVYLMLIFTRSLKWFLLVRTVKNKIRYKQLLPFYLTNSLIGNVTPFKSGETAIPFLLKKYLKISIGQGFSVVALDRFFEMIIFTVILVLAMLYMLNSGIQNSLTVSIFQGIFIVICLLLTILIILITSKKITLRTVRSFNFLKKYSLSKRWLEFIEKELNIFYTGLSLFKNKKVYQFMMPLTLLGWFFEILASYLIFNSILSIPFIDIAVVQIVAIAATFVTFIPGGVGVAEISVTYFLTLFGYPFVLTTSGVLLVRLFLTSTLFVTGLIGFFLIKERKFN